MQFWAANIHKKAVVTKEYAENRPGNVYLCRKLHIDCI